MSDSGENANQPGGEMPGEAPPAGEAAAPPPPPSATGSPTWAAQAPGSPPVGAGWSQPPPGMYLDPISGVLMPNGTQLASAGRRIGAFFLAIPLSIVTLGIGYLIWGLIVWGRGQTPTFQVLGMRCWRPETNRVAGWGWMALREIVGRFVEGILSLITEIVSFILFLSTKDRRSLHDMIAGTVVLHDPNKVLG